MDGKRFTKANPAVKPSHRGRLHAALNVPQGKTIPLSKLTAAAHSSNPHVRKMATYAETMRGWRH